LVGWSPSAQVGYNLGMSKVPPGTEVTPGTRGEPLAYVMTMEAATMDSMVMEQVDGIDNCCAGGEGIILGWRLLWNHVES